MSNTPIELDALIVGAGFGGTYQLWKLRKQGFRVKLVDDGNDFGGVWHWNCYPGARVDSTIPHYELSIPELWKDWKWKERFPGWEELQAYFRYAADKLDLRKDTKFNCQVRAATWDDSDCMWKVETDQGGLYKVQFLLLNIGFAAKRYIPPFVDMEMFKGTFIHPSYWPKDGFDLTGKHVAVIGTGSTGIQIAHEISDKVEKLVVFQRTPNTALPMGQRYYSGKVQAKPISEYSKIFSERKEHYSGFTFDFLPKGTFDDTPEERSKTYEQLWKEGDFHYWLATYRDMLFEKTANTEAYNFWRDKTRGRINDPKLKDILAPKDPPYAFGCKRISLENGYFEIFNQENVNLVDLNATPIEKFTAKGIQTSEKEWEFDYIVCATGYDAITGGLKNIDIRGSNKELLREKWAPGTTTYLGMSTSGYPNMFFTYGPQAPTALCNGPTCAELQGDWIAALMNYMRERQLKKIDASTEAEKGWTQAIWDIANTSLLPSTKSVSHQSKSRLKFNNLLTWK